MQGNDSNIFLWNLSHESADLAADPSSLYFPDFRKAWTAPHAHVFFFFFFLAQKFLSGQRKIQSHLFCYEAAA